MKVSYVKVSHMKVVQFQKVGRVSLKNTDLRKYKFLHWGGPKKKDFAT